MTIKLSGRIKKVLLAMLLVSVNALAMTSSRNKADRAGQEKSPVVSEPSSASRESTAAPTRNTSGEVAADPVYDSTVRSTPPPSSIDLDSSINKGSKRAQANKDCNMNDKVCIESKKAAQESLNRY